MDHSISKEPEFDFDAAREKLDSWKGNGAKQIVIEWNTGPGPTVFYYPAGQRQYGVRWRAEVPPSHYNEQYADFLEYKLAPKIQEVVQSRGLSATILCVDQQPVQVMRMRRRAIEQAQTSTSAH
ncbi:MAG TPA: hypothetical protein VFW40_11980 [Capsulimonadaceae bacterium]|nr:hypothetical protein [Capsulimonadaceae bacterium]